MFPIDIDCLDSDPENPRGPHRLAPVDHEIEQDLVKLSRIRAHEPGVRVTVHTQLDLLTDQPLTHRTQALDRASDIDITLVERLTSTERQELPRHRGRPGTRIRDRPHQGHRGLTARAGRGQVGRQHLGGPEQDRQQIVEVVRDPPRQTTDSLHLRDLSELLLHLASPSQVEGDPHQRVIPAGAQL